MTKVDFIQQLSEHPAMVSAHAACGNKVGVAPPSDVAVECADQCVAAFGQNVDWAKMFAIIQTLLATLGPLLAKPTAKAPTAKAPKSAK